MQIQSSISMYIIYSHECFFRNQNKSCKILSISRSKGTFKGSGANWSASALQQTACHCQGCEMNLKNQGPNKKGKPFHLRNFGLEGLLPKMSYKEISRRS